MSKKRLLKCNELSERTDMNKARTGHSLRFLTRESHSAHCAVLMAHSFSIKPSSEWVPSLPLPCILVCPPDLSLSRWHHRQLNLPDTKLTRWLIDHHSFRYLWSVPAPVGLARVQPTSTDDGLVWSLPTALYFKAPEIQDSMSLINPDWSSSTQWRCRTLYLLPD